MTFASATAQLVQIASDATFGPLFRLIDRFEAIAERRATRRALYAMSDIALADIGLTQADLSRSDPDCSWMSLITPQQRP